MSLAVKKTSLILAVLILVLAARASAQVNAGETHLSLNGTLSAGYSDDYSNTLGSDHSVVGAGQADLSGFYFNPNFLSFDVQPFYNQSRLNSSYQSLTAASGVTASATIFGGSHFPGSVSYSTTYNSSGNFNVPGLTNFTTHGNNDTLAINWGVQLDHLPSIHFSFSTGDNTYSIYGADSRGTLRSNAFSVTTAYRVAGFSLNGGYQRIGLDAFTPAFLAGDLAQQSDTGSNAFFFGVGHDLPWHGAISATATRLDISTSFGDTSSTDKDTTSIDTLSGSISFAPVPHLNLGGSTYYTDNLEGTLYNTLLTAGATVPQTELQSSSHDISLTGYANYDMPAEHMHVRAFAERQEQSLLGLSFAADSYDGTVTYSNRLRGGSFNGVLGVTRTSIEGSQQSTLGLISSVNYTHQVRGWAMAGGLSYNRDTQTVLIAYTSSGYNYNASLGRRIGRRSYWGAYGSGGKTMLTAQAGSANTSQSYSTSLSLPRFAISGSYSRSSGNALLTSTGLVSTPIPVTVLPSTAIVLYNGNSYSVGLGSSPIRGLTLSASYSRALSGTTSNAIISNNTNENFNGTLMYQFRKLNFEAGYSRLNQGFSVTGTPPSLEGSLFVGISRWFNFF